MKKAAVSLLALLMMATVAMADGRGGQGGPGRGPAGGFDGGRDGAGNVQVAADGTVYITRTVVDNTAGTITTQVTAVRSTGTVAFNVSLAGQRHLFLSGSNLISVSETTATDGTVSTTLSGISSSTGAATWTRTIAGRVTSLEAFSGGTYAIVVAPAATTGGTAARSLVAIGNDGSVLFTVALP